MHDTITVGVPVLAILFGILFQQRGLERLEARMDAKFKEVEARLDAKFKEVEARMDAKFREVDARFNALDGRIDRIHADFGQFHHTQGQHDARLDALEKKA